MTTDEMEVEKKYVVTIKQLAEIVKYCTRMTVAGSNNTKDWTYNVETAIEGVNGTEYMSPKIELEDLDTALKKQRERVIGEAKVINPGCIKGQELVQLSNIIELLNDE